MMAARSSVLMIWGMIVYLKLSSAQTIRAMAGTHFAKSSRDAFPLQ
jgi:hypothetical protein